MFFVSKHLSIILPFFQLLVPDDTRCLVLSGCRRPSVFRLDACNLFTLPSTFRQEMDVLCHPSFIHHFHGYANRRRSKTTVLGLTLAIAPLATMDIACIQNRRVTPVLHMNVTIPMLLASKLYRSIKCCLPGADVNRNLSELFSPACYLLPPLLKTSIRQLSSLIFPRI